MLCLTSHPVGLALEAVAFSIVEFVLFLYN